MADFKRTVLELRPATGYRAAFNNFTLNQTTDAVEYILQAPGVITITKIGFRYGVRTGTPPTFKASIQGVGTTGNPDGTIKGGGSPASVTFTPPADTSWNSTWQWVTLANSYTTALGEFFAIVITYDSGTIDGSNNSSFTLYGDTSLAFQNFPYAIQNDNGSRTHATAAPWIGYASSTVVYGFPGKTVANESFTAASTPDERGIAFTIPAGAASSYKVCGAIASLSGTAGGTVRMTLYQGTSVIQQIDIDGDLLTGGGVINRFLFDDTPVALTPGTEYILAFTPTAGTCVMQGLTLDSAGDMDAYALGQAVYKVTRTDSGAWGTDTATRYYIDLILDDVTHTAGGGGKILSSSIIQGVR